VLALLGAKARPCGEVIHIWKTGDETARTFGAQKARGALSGIFDVDDLAAYGDRDGLFPRFCFEFPPCVAQMKRDGR
jgi:hypothetical protein